MDKSVYDKLAQMANRMPFCSAVNLTNKDLDYYYKVYFNKSWAWWFNHIGTLIVFIIGFCGNLLCLLVLCRRRLRRNSYTQYLIALAIVDTGAILCEAFMALDELHQYRNTEKRTLLRHTAISCKLYYYVRYIFYSMSSWVIVALAVERLVAIKFPLWSKYVCNVINARRILSCILLFTMFIQSYHFIVKGLDCSSESRASLKLNCRCKTSPGFATIDIILTIYVWRLILMTLLPITIIITVNILIMNKLFNENTLVDHTNISDNSRRKTILLYKISRMLVLLSTVYLILHVPGSSLEIMKFMFINVFRICNTKWLYYMNVTHDIFDLLTNFNYGINFYLYIISGKHIRNELVRTFKHGPFRSESKQSANSRFQRSSYLLSSYAHLSKSNQTYTSTASDSRRATGTSL